MDDLCFDGLETIYLRSTDERESMGRGERGGVVGMIGTKNT